MVEEGDNRGHVEDDEEVRRNDMKKRKIKATLNVSMCTLHWPY